MRIKKVSIENFKCFKAVDLDLGKLTLLTGANSSGKSSILYGILGALQSGEFPYQFSPNGKYVNMGNFRDISYKHRKENIIKIDFKLVENETETNLYTLWEEDKVRKLPKLNRLKWEGDEWEISIVKGDIYTIDLKTLKEPLKRFSLGLDDFNQIPGLPVLENGRFVYDPFWGLTKVFSSLDHRINFINSFRLFPERTYYETTKTDLTVGKFGEDYVNQIILWETQKAKEYKELIKIMKELSLVDEIKSRRLDGGRFELVVKVNKNSVPASLNDVGFGISQFLPIVVADLQLGDESTLFVAQPEIHLHPSVQADFGSYLVNQVKASNKNYIIETHSEYLLNRIRLAIVKGEIPKEDVKIYYLQNDGEDTQTHPLEFTTDGRILNAPEDFFKTYQMDVMNIAMSADGE